MLTSFPSTETIAEAMRKPSSGILQERTVPRKLKNAFVGPPFSLYLSPRLLLISFSHCLL
jgi:hypothetical protein